MYEVILYAAVATIVCIVLYSVLGKSAGQDPSEKLNIKTTPFYKIDQILELCNRL